MHLVRGGVYFLLIYINMLLGDRRNISSEDYVYQ